MTLAASLKKNFKWLPLLAFPLGALAQQADTPPDDFSATGSLTAVSQYRLRGVSVSDGKPALQGRLTVAHKSGFYGNLWTSRLAGFGTYGGDNLELDATGGYTTTIDGTTLDGGVILYTFPGTHGHTYSEVFLSVGRTLGPVDLKLGLNYAPRRQSIGDHHNLYTYADLSLPIEGTPMKMKGHLGYTTGGSIYAGPRGRYVDYSIGAEAAWKALTFGLSYVGTDIGRSRADDYYTVPRGKPGRDLVKGALVFSVSAAF